MPDPCIRVRFIASGGFVSAAIRWVTFSLFSHVEFGTPEGTWIGAHDTGGVQERPASYCTPRREYVYEIPCTEEQLASHLARIRAQIGTPYNFTDILGLMIHKRMTSVSRVICSEFCTDELLFMFGAAKLLNVLGGYSYLVTPEILHLSPLFVGRLVKRKGSRG